MYRAVLIISQSEISTNLSRFVIEYGCVADARAAVKQNGLECLFRVSATRVQFPV
jgi:hypothetical protein